MSDRPRRRPVDTFLPVGPVVFDILLALSDEERHGYAILQEVAARTRGATVLLPGTLYRALGRMLDDGLIEEAGEQPAARDGGDERRRYYRLTTLGQDVAEAEARRLAALLRTARAKKVLRKADA
ncbi:MAG TPA: PadR family transcriptional regulator [Vicinamibacteria bacterium]|nr:PadR family transcriptional regulator [Vicinamibacteria bacterium]